MERKEERSRLRIAARIEKSPKPIGTQGFWTMVPVAGLEPARHRWRWILSPHGNVERGVFRRNAMDSGESKKPLRCNNFLSFTQNIRIRGTPDEKCKK